MEKSYKYVGYILLILVPLTIIGFYKTYISLFPNFTEKTISLTALTHLHAFIGSVWLLTLIVQPILIANRKNAAHKAIGRLTYILFPVFILSFIPQIIKIIYYEDHHNLFFPFADGSLLISFYLLAIWNKKNVAKHMRYMIACTLVFLGPTFGRIGPNVLGWRDVLTQNIQYLLTYSILLSLIVYDRSNHKRYKPYLVSAAFFVVHQAVFYAVFLGR